MKKHWESVWKLNYFFVETLKINKRLKILKIFKKFLKIFFEYFVNFFENFLKKCSLEKNLAYAHAERACRSNYFFLYSDNKMTIFCQL